jgi:hypothetical protein
MAPASRTAIDLRNEVDYFLRKGIPILAEMATVFATEEAAFQYLLAEKRLDNSQLRNMW